MDFLSTFFNAKIAWFVIGILLIVVEFLAPTFVCIFFSLGAFVVMGLLFFVPLTLNAQLGIFIGASILSIIVIRNKCVILFRGHATEKNPEGDLCDDFKGFKVPVEVDISPLQNGKVLFRGSSWDAQSKESLPKGSTVEITGKNGIVLKVKKI